MPTPSHMTFASVSQFFIYFPWVNPRLALCLNFIQEKTLVGAFSVIVKLREGSFEALVSGQRHATCRQTPVQYRHFP